MRYVLTLLLAAAVAAASLPAAAGADAQAIRFSGQLLDVRGGFAYFTTGDGYRLAPGVKYVDAKTGGPPAAPAQVKTYARATFDPASGQIVELALSSSPLPAEAPIEAVHRFAVALSAPSPNPELIAGAAAGGFNGKPVSVVFTVEVPARTPLTDSVYIATDQSNWDPMAIKMDRVDALHFRIARDFNSGTILFYRFTRGSWQSSERGPDGLEGAPHRFVVRNADTLTQNVTVANWSDQNVAAPDLGPQNIPTPFNNNPFPFPLPSPTPRPARTP